MLFKHFDHITNYSQIISLCSMFSFGRLYLYCVDNITPTYSFSIFSLISTSIGSYVIPNNSNFQVKYKSVLRMDRPYCHCLQPLVSAHSFYCKELSCIHTLWLQLLIAVTFYIVMLWKNYMVIHWILLKKITLYKHKISCFLCLIRWNSISMKVVLKG